MAPKISTSDAASVLDITVQGLHKKLKKHNWPYGKVMNKLYFEHDTAKKLFNFKFNPQIISVQIVKGGTGKTTLCHSIATRANLYGARVLCIDLDQQGNLTQSFNINASESPIMVDILESKSPLKDAIVNISPGLDIVPSRIENATLDNYLLLNVGNIKNTFTKLINPIRKNYDLIIFDCAPNLGKGVAAAALASDYVITPVTPEQFSINGLKLTFEGLKDLQEDFGIKSKIKILLNKFDNRTSLSHEVLISLFENETYKESMFQTYVRLSQEFPNVISDRKSIYDSLKPSNAKEDIDLVTQDILGLTKVEIDA